MEPAAPWWIDQLEVVIGIVSAVAAGLWAGARWTQRIEGEIRQNTATTEAGFKRNDEVHGQIIETVQDGHERLSRVEEKVEDHRRRYP